MSSDNYIEGLAEKINARDGKRNADWERVQGENRLKQQKGKEVFSALKKWSQDACGQLWDKLGRNAVRFQFHKSNPEFSLIGEGSDSNRVDVVLAEDGSIKYKSPLLPDGEGAFVPSVENGDHVRYYDGNGRVMLAEDMGKVLLSLVTR